MQYSKTISPRTLQFALLAVSLLTLAVTGPTSFDAMRAIIGAPFSLSGMAAAAKEPGEPTADLAGALPGSTVAPFILSSANPADRERAVHCLSEAVYYEAGHEPLAGQRAVAQVVLNRVRDRNFPDTVCGVVYQGWWRKTGCQFSFVCDGSLVRRPPGEEEWHEARAVAEQALNGYVAVEVGSATHYHTDYVNPYWGPKMVEIAKVGAHIFYRWPGKAGEIASLTQQYVGGEVGFWEAASKKSPRTFARREPV